MLDFSRFRVLTFDCYGTLIDWESGIFAALRPILAAHNKALPDSALLELYGELEAKAEEGEFRPYREVLQSIVLGFGKRLNLLRPQPNFLPCLIRWPTGSHFPIQLLPFASSKLAIS